MSVLAPTTTTPDVQTAQQIMQLAQNQFVQLARTGQLGYNLIWNNPRGVTPQQAIAALGTNAQAIFGLAQLNIATIGEAAAIGGATAPSLPSIPAGWTITFNSDGSANVTAPVSVPKDDPFINAAK